MLRYILPFLLIAGVLGGCADKAPPPHHHQADAFLPQSVCDNNSGLRVWVDTDVVIAPDSVSADPDDGIALAMLRQCLSIVGVSTTSANAPEHLVWKTAQQLAEYGYVVSRGQVEYGCRSPAVQEMAKALERAPMTIVALGALTNVADLIRCHPHLIDSIEEVVAIGGRTEGDEFWLGNGGLSLRPMKDLNYEANPRAFELVLDSVPVRLFGFEAGEAVRLSYADLAPLLDSAGVLGQPLVSAVRNWAATLQLVGGGGTIPAFDPVAVVGVLNPDLFDCVPGSATQTASLLVFIPEMGSSGDTSFCRATHPELIKQTILGYIARN